MCYDNRLRKEVIYRLPVRAEVPLWGKFGAGARDLAEERVWFPVEEQVREQVWEHVWGMVSPPALPAIEFGNILRADDV